MPDNQRDRTLRILRIHMVLPSLYFVDSVFGCRMLSLRFPIRGLVGVWYTPQTGDADPVRTRSVVTLCLRARHAVHVLPREGGGGVSG